MTSSPADPIRLRLDAPSTARAGSRVSITLRVDNLRDEPTELTLRGRTIAFDIVVRHAGGQVVWRRLDGAVIPGIARLEVLAPRAVLELRTDWSLTSATGTPLPPGDYTLEGVLFTDGPGLRTPPVPLRLIAEAILDSR